MRRRWCAAGLAEAVVTPFWGDHNISSPGPVASAEGELCATWLE